VSRERQAQCAAAGASRADRLIELVHVELCGFALPFRRQHAGIIHDLDRHPQNEIDRAVHVDDARKQQQIIIREPAIDSIFGCLDDFAQMYGALRLARYGQSHLILTKSVGRAR
jgi:hypothetical protein